MATIQNTPNPEPNKFTPAPKPQKNRSTLLGVIIAVLAVALVVLGISFMNRGTENAQLSTELMEMEQFKGGPLTSERKHMEQKQRLLEGLQHQVLERAQS